MSEEPISRLFTALPMLSGWPQPIANLSLDGRAGTNRDWQNRCQIHAAHDYEAIQCWLNEYRHKATTYRTYRKEVERFLLWCLYQQQKPLSSVDRHDIESYMNFLDDPQPRHLWCAKPGGGQARQRGEKAWRPFVGALGASAKATAVSTLDSLFSYLVQAHYLLFNPLTLIRKRNTQKVNTASSTILIQERILTLDEWHTMLDVLDAWPESSIEGQKEKHRLRLMVCMLYFLGLRIEELATHTWSAFKKLEDAWWFIVVGKGNKLGKIPVNDELVRIIIDYRLFLHRPPLPSSHETAPLIQSFRTGKALTPRYINKLLKKLALETAQHFKHQPEKANKLKKFSAHWLRHLSASMQDRAGIAFKHIRSNLRHENDETTRRYIHAQDQERYQEIQKLKLRMMIE